MPADPLLMEAWKPVVQAVRLVVVCATIMSLSRPVPTVNAVVSFLTGHARSRQARPARAAPATSGRVAALLQQGVIALIRLLLPLQCLCLAPGRAQCRPIVSTFETPG